MSTEYLKRLFLYQINFLRALNQLVRVADSLNSWSLVRAQVGPKQETLITSFAGS
ncbi:MAG: hypothetical protein CM15mP83_8200 [Flavobacteriaceae bacterium]|nr:MAG: hypothetical protein CM15mP83_8200 [Flavobacteriaceae bacterium]